MNPPLHSKLGASSMTRWESCPGSVRLCENIPSVSNAYAEEGTKAHEIAARGLQGESILAICDDPSMAEAAQMYVDIVMTDYLTRRRRSTRPDHREHLYVEHRLDLSSVYPKCFGTADAIIWDEEAKLIRVYDFKYGKGVHVEAENNSQLLYYALGAAVTLEVPASEVECIIVQPRCKSRSGLVRRWRFPSIDLMDFEARLVAAARKTEDPKAELVIGRHCYWCPAKPTCPAHHDNSVQDAISEFTEITSEDLVG